MTNPIEPTEVEIEVAARMLADHAYGWGDPEAIKKPIIDATWAQFADQAKSALIAARQVSPQKTYADGIEDAAKVAEHMLRFADTTSAADIEIAAAIRAFGKEGS